MAEIEADNHISSSTCLTQGQLENCCEICNQNCSQRCSTCRKVAYCCKDHQKLDWKSHKSECFPAIVKYNDVVGRHLVATRDIKMGEILLKEKPLVAGPKNCGKNGQFLYPICLTCFRIVGAPYLCSKCKWPMCNAQCESMPSHRDNECQIFVKQNIIPTPQMLNEVHVYEKIIILRALLCKKSQPKIWSKIADLQSHSEIRTDLPTGILPTLMAVKFIQKLCGLTQFSIEEIDHVVGALETNVFGNDDSSIRISSPHFRSSTYLYYYACIAAHNCQPNAVWTIQKNSEFHERATVPIAAGDSIAHLYSPATVSTMCRRKHLKSTKFFDCSCTRCQDPIELGTHFSSLKCSNCKESYLVPTSPLDYNTDWICQTPNCNCEPKSANNVETLMKDIDNEIQTTLNKHSKVDAPTIVKCIKSLTQLIEKYCPSCLHPNHYHIFNLQIMIIQKISLLFSASSASSVLAKIKLEEKLDLLETMIDLVGKVFKIADVILPGYTTLRGRLFYFLQQGLTIKLFLVLSAKNGNALSKSKSEECRKELKTLHAAREEAIKIFANEPEGREEYLLRKMMSEPSNYLQFIESKLS